MPKFTWSNLRDTMMGPLKYAILWRHCMDWSSHHICGITNSLRSLRSISHEEYSWWSIVHKWQVTRKSNMVLDLCWWHSHELSLYLSANRECWRSEERVNTDHHWDLITVPWHQLVENWGWGNMPECWKVCWKLQGGFQQETEGKRVNTLLPPT